MIWTVHDRRAEESAPEALRAVAASGGWGWLRTRYRGRSVPPRAGRAGRAGARRILRREFSVNVGGRVNVAGTAQRMTAQALLFSAVVLVEDPGPVRAMLSEAYRLLGLDWDPQTLGCVSDTLPGVTTMDVGEVLLDELARVLSLGAGDGEDFPLERCWEVPL